MDTRLKGLFSKRTTTHQQYGTRRGPLQAIPYDSAIALTPPIKGSYPVAGNGPAIIDQFRLKTEGKLEQFDSDSDSEDSFADDESADPPSVPRNKEDRPQSSRRSNEYTSPATRGRPKTKVLDARIMGQPTKPEARRLSYKPKIAPRIVAIKTNQPSEAPARARLEDLKTLDEPLPLPQPSFLGTRKASPSPSRGANYVDLADAVVNIFPEYAQELQKQRNVATGIRIYGEDVADRNMTKPRKKSPRRRPPNIYTGREPDRDFQIIYHDQRRRLSNDRERRRVDAEDIPSPMASPAESGERGRRDAIGQARRARWQNARQKPATVVAYKPQPATYIPSRGPAPGSRPSSSGSGGMRDVSSRIVARPRKTVLSPVLDGFSEESISPPVQTQSQVKASVSPPRPISRTVSPRSSSVPVLLRAKEVRIEEVSPVTSIFSVDANPANESTPAETVDDGSETRSRSTSRDCRSTSRPASRVSQGVSVFPEVGLVKPRPYSASFAVSSTLPETKTQTKHISEQHFATGSGVAVHDATTQRYSEPDGRTIHMLSAYERSKSLEREALVNLRFRRPVSAGPTLINIKPRLNRPKHPSPFKRVPDDKSASKSKAKIQAPVKPLLPEVVDFAKTDDEDHVNGNRIDNDDNDSDSDSASMFSVPRLPRDRKHSAPPSLLITRSRGNSRASSRVLTGRETAAARETNSHFRLSDFTDEEGGPTSPESIGDLEEGLLFQENGYGLEGMLPGISAGDDEDDHAYERVREFGSVAGGNEGVGGSLLGVGIRSGHSKMTALREKELALQQKLAMLNIDLRE